MLLSIPPRPSDRPRLLPGLPLRAGDPIAGRNRVLSLLRADRACAHFAAVQQGSSTKVEVQILLAMDEAIEPVHLRFLADARKAAVLQSPTVQRILQVGVTPEGQPFVVREAQQGELLATLLTRVGSLSNENAVDVALAVCEALESAHAHGVVHGEIDPSAVQLVWSSDGPTKVKLGGLGTTRALALLPHDGRSFAALACRAPEQRSDAEIDGRADVWGVGVLLYTMLAGAPPFAASPSTMNVAAALDEPAMLAGVPDGLAEIVDACLSREPSARPQTAAALAAKLALFGTRPVFEKRASLLVVDTGPYDAIVLERLVKEAGPSDASIDVVMEPSVPDVTAAARERPPATTVVTPVVAIRPTSPSTAPVALSITPPASSSAAPLAAQLAPAPAPRSSRTMLLFVAAACIGFGAVVGVLSSRMSSTPSSAAAHVSHVSQPPPAVTALPPAPLDTPVASTATPAAPITPSLAVGDLPAMPAATAASPRARGEARPRAASPSAPSPASPASPARGPAADTAPAVDPIVRSAAAPIQPQPKASDDDLRRFLDDRR